MSGKTILVYMPDGGYGLREDQGVAFTTDEKCLDYFKAMYPMKKRLRLIDAQFTNLVILVNHTTPALPARDDIRRVRVDP